MESRWKQVVFMGFFIEINMRSVLLFILMAGLIRCSAEKHDVPIGFVKRKVTLVKRQFVPSPAGTITLNVPTKYDTLLVWLDVSDNQMSHRPKYRFTNSKGCLLQESGFFKWEGEYCKDSLDRLTIETELAYDDEMTEADLDGTMHYWDERTKAIGGVATSWKAKKIEVINGRTFGIIESFGSGKLIGKPYEQLYAAARFKQAGRPWQVVFRFDCKQRDCRDFAKNAYAVLRSVMIDTLAQKQK